MKQLSQNFERGLNKVISAIAFIGMSVVVLLVLLTTADAFLRTVFNHPITGASELSEFMLSFMIFFGLAYTAMEKGHVEVDLIFSQFPERVQPIVKVVINLLSLVICLLITWQTFVYGLAVKQHNVLSATLNAPIFPFVFVTSFGVGLLSLVLLRDLFHSILDLWREK